MTYWQDIVGARTTRRRVLAATGMGTAAAAFLAACGGGSDSENKSSDGKAANDRLFKPTDTSSKAVPGGTWQRIYPGTLLAANVDPYAKVGLNSGLALHVHSRMFQYKPTVYPDVPTTEVAPDAADSYELSPDKMTLTFKMKGDVKFDSRQPTNGRPVQASDVVFSWNRFAAQAPNRKDMINSLNPFGPVLSATNPDEKTVVFKLAYPYVPIVGFLAYPRYGQIQPKETDSGGFNPELESRGSGPWRIDRFEKDVELRFVRNPDWYNKGKPFFDAMSYKFLPEYATVLSQFRSGAIWEYHQAGQNSLIRGDDVLPLKRDVPKLNMIQTPAYSRTANVIFYLEGGLAVEGRPRAPGGVDAAGPRPDPRHDLRQQELHGPGFAGRQALAHPHPGRRDAVLRGPQVRRLRSVIQVLQARPRRSQGAAQGRRLQRAGEAEVDRIDPHTARPLHADLRRDDAGV